MLQAAGRNARVSVYVCRKWGKVLSFGSSNWESELVFVQPSVRLTTKFLHITDIIAGEHVIAQITGNSPTVKTHNCQEVQFPTFPRHIFGHTNFVTHLHVLQFS